MQQIAAFVRLTRPKFLLGGFVGFALGAAVAAYEGARITPAAYAAGQSMVTAFHLMTHYANDYFDRYTDADAGRTDFSGGSGVLTAGALAPRTALVAALVCAGAGAIAVLAFALAGAPVVALIGAAIGVLAWVYSAPPLRLAARGWGELDAVLVVGMLVPLAGYAVFRGTIDWLALSATIGPACAMFAMMIGVEWPDRDADAAGRKRNLVVRLGSPAGARLAAGGALLVVPALLLAIRYGAPWTGAALGLLLVPPIYMFICRIDAANAVAAEVAARGVTVFLLTDLFVLFGYLAVLR